MDNEYDVPPSVDGSACPPTYSESLDYFHPISLVAPFLSRRSLVQCLQVCRAWLVPLQSFLLAYPHLFFETRSRERIDGFICFLNCLRISRLETRNRVIGLDLCELEGTPYRDIASDAVALLFSHCPNVMVLNLSRTNWVHAKSFELATTAYNLQKLDLSDCNGVTQVQLVRLFELVPNVYVINISGLRAATATLLARIPTLLKNLRVLVARKLLDNLDTAVQKILGAMSLLELDLNYSNVTRNILQDPKLFTTIRRLGIAGTKCDRQALHGFLLRTKDFVGLDIADLGAVRAPDLLQNHPLEYLRIDYPPPSGARVRGKMVLVNIPNGAGSEIGRLMEVELKSLVLVTLSEDSEKLQQILKKEKLSRMWHGKLTIVRTLGEANRDDWLVDTTIT